MRARHVVALVTALLVSSGCAGTKKVYRQLSGDLDKASRLFNDYVRWGYAEKASDFVEPAKKQEFEAWRRALDKQINITDVHVDSVDFPGGPSNEATVKVTWTFYRVNQLTEQTKSATEHWFAKDLRWYVKFEPDAFPAGGP